MNKNIEITLTFEVKCSGESIDKAKTHIRDWIFENVPNVLDGKDDDFISIISIS